MAHAKICDSCNAVIKNSRPENELWIYKTGFWSCYFDWYWTTVHLCPTCFSGLKKIAEKK